jgi:hypothetical protein
MVRIETFAPNVKHLGNVADLTNEKECGKIDTNGKYCTKNS